MALTTPALLFSAISLLLLAYTNRFLSLASLIRNLDSEYRKTPDPHIKGQIENLSKRVRLIRDMQILGVVSFFLCVFTMLLIFAGRHSMADVTFGLSLLFLMASLAQSIWELVISVKALNLQLEGMGGEEKKL